MNTFRLANPTMPLLSAATMALLTVFASGSFFLGGTALAQELPTDDPPVNFHVTSYDDTSVGLEWRIPRNRGITNSVLQRYTHNGSKFESFYPRDFTDWEVVGGAQQGFASYRLSPDTQYKYVLRLKDDSGTTIIETSVTFRTLPASDEPSGEPTLSTDVTLSSLSLSGIDIGSFSANKQTYVATVANSVTQTTVSATANHEGASYVIWPGTNGVISLSVGINEITVTVTAEDGISTRVYSIFVTRAGTDETPTPDPSDPTDETPTPDPSISTDATLSSLSLSGIDFSRPFSPGRYHYDASVAEDVTETTVTAMPDKPEASYVIKLNGEVKDDGFIPLSVGSSVITVEVTAEDGITSQTYTVTVTRQGVTDELPTDDPPVNFHVTSYDDTWVGLEWRIPRNRGITNCVLQRYTHNGSKFESFYPHDFKDWEVVGGAALGLGDYDLSPDTQYKYVLRLKDDSGTTIIETSVTFRTLPASGEPTLSTDRTLSSLSLSGIDIGSFSANKQTYVATVANSVTQTTVSATANHEGASYVIWPGTNGVISLSVGINEITVTVTAEDGISTRVYSIFVTRAGTDEIDDGEMDDGEEDDSGEDDGEEDDSEDNSEDDGIMAFAFAEGVEDQAYTAGTAITALVLPEATGGEGEVTYRVFGLPAGLSFDAATRTISGTPTAATDGAIEVTCLAEDSAGASAILTFSITVNPPLNFGDLFGDLFDLLNGDSSDAEDENN